jgi:hypothetical protein
LLLKQENDEEYEEYEEFEEALINYHVEGHDWEEDLVIYDEPDEDDVDEVLISDDMDLSSYDHDQYLCFCDCRGCSEREYMRALCPASRYWVPEDEHG